MPARRDILQAPERLPHIPSASSFSHIRIQYIHVLSCVVAGIPSDHRAHADHGVRAEQRGAMSARKLDVAGIVHHRCPI
jgi:hypothetical protein